MEGIREDIPDVTRRHDIYTTIDPTEAYSSKLYEGKVVFIAGASRGIGEESAITYARAGAAVAISGRKQTTLEAVKASILTDVPQANVIIIVMDVTNVEQVESAVNAIIGQFGRLDVAVANAGSSSTWDKSISQSDPFEWWSVVEVNLRGVYNIARYTLPHLVAAKGTFIALSSLSAQLRIPYASSYGVSKHAVSRFVEFIQMESPDVRAFSFHPGSVKTEVALLAIKDTPNEAAYEAYMIDTPQLPACTMLYLSSGGADFLAGRFVNANWDLAEVEEKYKAKILERKALVNRLDIPV